MGVVEHDPRGWTVAGTWADEPAADALARTPAFGRRFFAAVFAEFPALAAAARFLRWSVQPGDVYAVFGWPGGGAGAQIDPDLEYIIVWGPAGRRSTGTGARTRSRRPSITSADWSWARAKTPNPALHPATAAPTASRVHAPSAAAAGDLHVRRRRAHE